MRAPISSEGGGISGRAPISARADILRRDIGVSVYRLQREMKTRNAGTKYTGVYMCTCMILLFGNCHPENVVDVHGKQNWACAGRLLGEQYEILHVDWSQTMRRPPFSRVKVLPHEAFDKC